MIYKMLSGGGASPFTYYRPNVVNTQRPLQVTTSKAETKKDDGLNDKDLMDMLGKIGGLPSDMKSIYDMLTIFYQEKELGVSVSSLESTYLMALQQLKTAEFNKEQYNNAYKTVSKSGGLNEIAISETGHVIARDAENNIKYLTPDEYLNNKDKYAAYTNHNLLKLRSDNPLFAYQNGVFDVVNNGIGLPTVDKLIQQYMINLGENQITNGGYIKNKGNGVIEGIEVLQSAAKQAALAGYKFDVSGVSLEGLYKTKMLTKELFAQAKHALTYIYSMLPDNAKTLLKVKTGSDKNSLDLIAGFVTGQTSTTYEFTPDMEEDDTGKKPGTQSSSSDGMHDDLFQDIIKGEGGSEASYTIMDKDGVSYQILGTAYPSLARNPEKPVKALTTLAELMTENNLNGIYLGNGYAITFGNNVLSASDMEDVVALNDGKSVRTILPVKYENGQAVPDLEFIQKYPEIMNLINSKHQNMNDPEVQKALKDAGIINPYTGLPDMSMFKPYLCINGLATSRNIKNPTMSKEIIGDQLNSYVKLFENTVYKKGGELGKDKKFDFDTFSSLNPLDWFGLYDKLYSGTIFIPITQNILQGGQAAGTTIKTSQADNLERQYQKGQIMSTAKPTSSNLLGL